MSYESGVQAGLGVGPAGGQRDLITGQPNLSKAVNMKTKTFYTCSLGSAEFSPAPLPLP